MPIPMIAAPIIGAGVNALSQVLGNQSTNSANQKMAEYQYQKDLEMWNRANEYNSPVAQMKRLKDAGLNPNMVYGSGSVVGNTSTQTPKYQAPTLDNHVETKFDVIPAISAYQDMQVKKAQIDNINAQTKNAITDNILKGIQSTGMQTANARSKFDLDQAKKLAKWNYQAAEMNVKNLMKDLQVKDSNIQSNDSAINLRTEQRKNVIMENELNKLGIQKGDNMFFRMAARLFNSPAGQEFHQKQSNQFKQFFHLKK